LQHRAGLRGEGEEQAGTEEKEETNEFHSKAFPQMVAGALECSWQAVVDLRQTNGN
jgi:hypothetical protein